MSSDQGWDAGAYDEDFGYVSRLGAGVFELAAVQPGERVLDLGCGTGTLMAGFVAAGAHVTGIDADPDMIAAARAAGLDARVGDGHDVTVDEPVDVVFSNAALHWMTRPDDVASSVAGALRPGGRFVAEMGGARNVATVVDAVRAEGARRGVEVRSPWWFPTVAEQSAVLERAGFRVASMEHVERPTPLQQDQTVVDWLTMFGGPLLSGFHADQRDDVAVAVRDATEETLSDRGRWSIDYWRLRFVAILD